MLHLLYIAQFDKLSQRQIEVKEFWESRFRESETKYTRHDLGDGTTVINNFINKNDIDLLVLVNSKHSFLESFLKTTTIDALGLNLKIPFLILQNLAR
ncbi:UspA protein [Nonlabens ulvanivorans]|nr:UspA protein [Nonlabens ulvanivorans]